jgi:hypothetical protein
MSSSHKAMTLPKYSPQSDKCTDEEIEKFVRERGVKGLPSKRVLCLQVLRALDEDASFRFLDLAPELRNTIYHYVLTPSAQHAQAEPFSRLTCFWQILSTCKQVHFEASDLLHQATSISLHLHLGLHHMKDNGIIARSHRTACKSISTEKKSSPPDDQTSQLPFQGKPLFHGQAA